MTSQTADWNGTARLLRAGLRASMAGHAAAVMAVLGILHQGWCAGYAAALAAWGWLVYLQVRVALDAELFGWLAEGAEAEEIDAFLVNVRLIRAPRRRTAAERCRGAWRLWRQLMTALVIELLAAGLGLATGNR